MLTVTWGYKWSLSRQEAEPKQPMLGCLGCTLIVFCLILRFKAFALKDRDRKQIYLNKMQHIYGSFFLFGAAGVITSAHI